MNFWHEGHDMIPSMWVVEDRDRMRGYSDWLRVWIMTMGMELDGVCFVVFLSSTLFFGVLVAW
jgi:hypothetical protein